MPIEEMKLAEVAERRTAILTELDADGADLAALGEEIRALDLREAEIETELRAKDELRAQARKAGKVIEKRKETTEMPNTYDVNSAEYRGAFMKNLMNRSAEMTEAETQAWIEVRSMTTDSGSAGAAVPTSTMNKVQEKMIQIAPILEKVSLSFFSGPCTLPVESVVNAAAIHTQNATITPSSDVLTYISLNAYEITKALRISASLRASSIDFFETWVANNLGKSMARLLNNYLINGSGSSQPTGIKYANTWSDGSNAVDWASTAPTVAEIEEMIGYLPGGYDSSAVFLMKKSTFWTYIHPLRDEKKPEIVTGNPATGYQIFGYPVLMDDYVAAGEMYFGDLETVYANMAEGINIKSSDASGFLANAVDYRIACQFDCKPSLGEAWIMSRATV